MNILVVAHYQNDGSPSACFIHDQVQAYCALGHNVRVLSPIALGKLGLKASGRFQTVQQVFDGIWHLHMRFLSLSNFGTRKFNTVSAIAALRRHYAALTKDFRPDVIHAHTFGLDSEMGVWLKKKLGVPLVVTTHGSDISVPYAYGRTNLLKGLCDGVDTVIGVSSQLTAKLAKCGVTKPMHSILNGFAIEHLSPTKKTPDSWIQVGNLVSSKHVDTTLRAFAIHKKTHPAAQLTIVGQGYERSNLERLCAELGISHAVRFAGTLPNEQVLKEMAKTHFFVMPSHPEGFGIVYLEAMANGCITIGTKGEGITDLIVSGENGFLVPPDDPEAIAGVIDWCLQHPTEATAIATRGQQAAQGLTWEKNAKQYVDFFEELIEICKNY